MENKFRQFLINGTLYTGGIFFVITFVIYHMGCSERTLVYWSLMTVIMYLTHIVLKLSSVELEQTRIRKDIMEINLALAKDELEKSLNKLEETLEKAQKKLKIRIEEDIENK